MANIKLKDKNGSVTTYSDVEIFEVPSAVSGQTVQFVDANNATAVAGDILSGKTAFVGTSQVTGTIATKSASDVSAVADTVTVPAGYYAGQVQKAVAAGAEGTPSATKGTVSNHSISVTPSVTNTAGYIAGTTKTGSAVTVSAGELVSGTSIFTANGTYDVTNLAGVQVSIPVYAGSIS